MIGLTLGKLVNIILDPVLILGLCDCPAMGNTGAAVATVIGNIVGASYYIAYFLFGKSMLSIRPQDVSFRDRIPLEVF